MERILALTAAHPFFTQLTCFLLFNRAWAGDLKKDEDVPLVDWEMLRRVDSGYRFFIELMRRWVAKNKPLFLIMWRPRTMREPASFGCGAWLLSEGRRQQWDTGNSSEMAQSEELLR